MRARLFLLFCAVVSMPAAQAQAQATLTPAPTPTPTPTPPLAADSGPAHHIFIRPVKLIFDELAVDYERRLGRAFSLQGGLRAGLAHRLGLSGAAVALDSHLGLMLRRGDGFAVEVGGRWYPRGDAPCGVFLSPSLTYDHQLPYLVEPGSPGRVQRRQRLMANARIGVQAALLPHLAAAAAIGVSYVHTHLDGSGWRSGGFAPDLLISLGALF